jgi:prophage DNA circulation protein
MSSPIDYANAAQALVAALAAATVDPADAVRILVNLANFAPIQADVTPVAWAPAASMQSAVNDLFRRSAVIALAAASASYQPSSSDDAVRLRTLVVNMLGAEIDIAGDQGEDETFNALRVLSAAVVADLTARGAALPSIRQYKASTALPAPVIAQMLYRDPSRADELVGEANPPHPAFMPTSIKVLSS